jgi:tryptophan-rich sensory protein
MSLLDIDDDPKRVQRQRLYYFLLATLGVGALASLITAPAIPTWYAGLSHPAIAPPNWVFAPVWTALYVLMAAAAWRVWKQTGLRSAEMTVYAVQLALNFAWSAIFFGLHRIGAALFEIAALDLAVLATAILFVRRDRLAGLLFAPYLAWVLFAAALTHAFWRRNGG